MILAEIIKTLNRFKLTMRVYGGCYMKIALKRRRFFSWPSQLFIFILKITSFRIFFNTLGKKKN